MEERPLVSLTSIDVQEAEAKVFDNHEAFISLLSEHDVQTSRGKLRVSRQGKDKKPAIVTFHDIGQNHTSAFLGFFNFTENRPLLDNFCIYHIDAPGQEENSDDLGEEYQYPTMDELSDMVGEVVDFFDIKRFIGFGVGAGANILSRYALWHPTRVEALVLLELVASNGGWIEWGYQKLCVRQLKNKGLTTFVEDYLLWHHFGKKTKEENMDLVHAFKQSIQSVLNPRNLSLFINSYLHRTDLQIHRPDKTSAKKVQALKCPALLITGATSPHQDDVVNTNSRLDPEVSTYFSVSESGGMPLEEQPHKVATSVILFLQGLGYLTRLHTQPPKVTPQATQEPTVC